MLAFILVTSFESLTAQPTLDTLSTNDSIVQALNNQVRELKLERVMLQNELTRTGMSIRLDSLQRINRQRQIDSLREVTQGVPLVVEKDTLLFLYARKGGMLPEARVKAATEIIRKLGRKLSFRTDTLQVFESDMSSDIMAGEEVILSITDLDAMWQVKPRTQLANEYAQIIQAKITTLHEEYGLQ